MTSKARGTIGGPLVIGLTGPIGCGKSTVAGWLAEEGAVVIDADVLAREVVEPGSPALAEIVTAFGAGIIRPDGRLDRAALGSLVFGDPAALARLESITHPAVRPRILAAIGEAAQAGARIVVLEAIRLVEGGWAGRCSEVWLVTCDGPSQRRRLAERGLPDDQAARRIAAQAGLEARVRPVARRVIDTSGDQVATRSAVAAALEAALRS